MLCSIVLSVVLSAVAADPPRSVYSVADYGAVPGDRSGKTVDTAMDRIRQAIADRDAASPQTGALQGATIRFPASALPWVVGRPHWIDGTGWEVVGDGRNNTSVIARDFRNHPAFIFGWPMRPSPRWSKYPGTTLSPDFHPDAFGVLDVSACAAPGQRWGLKLTPEVSASFPASPFSSGPGDGRQYDKLRQHTLEILYVPPDPSKALPSGAICGFGDWVLTSRNLNDSKAALILYLKLTASDGTPTAIQTFEVTVPTVAPAYRITVQIDLDAGKAQFYVNGVQLARNPKAAAIFDSGVNLSYYRNDLYPFSVGFNGPSVDAYGTQFPPLSGSVYGLRETDRAIYADDGPGSRQRRTDGVTITDYSRYFDPGAGCFAYLPLSDPPSNDPDSVAEGRLVSWSSAGPNQAAIQGYGFFVFNSTGANPGSVSRNEIRDMTVRTSGAPRPTGTNPYGQGIAVGSVMEFHASRLDVTGGAHGIGSINFWPSWMVYYDDLRLKGTDAGLYAFRQLIEADNFHNNTPIRTGLRFWGSAASVKGAFFGETCALTQANVMIHGDQYGGSYQFENFLCDTEVGAGPVQGAIVMETNPFAITQLRITDLGCGQLPASAAPIVLRGNPRNTQSRSPVAIVDGVSVWSAAHRGTVVRQSGAWKVSVDNSVILGGTPSAASAIPAIFDEFPAK